MGGAQGNPNPVYYKLAASSVASSVFHGITTGDIAVNCSGDINCFGSAFVGRGRSTTPFDGNGGLSATSQTYTPAFAAASGWNFATGLRQRGCLQPDHELEQRPVTMTRTCRTLFF